MTGWYSGASHEFTARHNAKVEILNLLEDQDALTPDTLDAVKSWSAPDLEPALRDIGEKLDLKEIERDHEDDEESGDWGTTRPLFDWVKQGHPVTNDITIAGYALPNGDMLSFSNDGRTRDQDHREVSWPYGTAGQQASGTYKMIAMMNAGAMRMDARSGAISLRRPPTGAQERIITRILDENGSVSIDAEIPGKDGFNESGRESFNIDDEVEIERAIKKIRAFYRRAPVQMMASPRLAGIVTTGDLQYHPAAWRDGRLVVSTRTPTAVGRKAQDSVLIPNLDDVNSEALVVRLADLVKHYSQVSKEAESGNPTKIVRSMIGTIKNNLRFLYTEFTKNDGDLASRARLWYAGANRIAHRFASDFGISLEQASAIIAVLSPQRDWFQNVSQAFRALSAIKFLDANDSEFTQDYAKHYDLRIRKSLKGAKSAFVKKYGLEAYEKKVSEALIDAANLMSNTIGLIWSKMSEEQRAVFVRMHSELNDSPSYPTIAPEGDFGPAALNQNGSESNLAWGSYATIERVISIYYNGSVENISKQLGDEHKVRSFFNNINNPFDEQGFTTIDTHANAASLLEPLGGSSPQVKASLGGAPGDNLVGTSGTYIIYHQAHKELADELTKETGEKIYPREVQSITWEAVRLLFDNKSDAIKGTAKSLWKGFHDGNITLHGLQQSILETAGGIPAPVWSSIPAQTASKQGALLDDTVGSRLTGISIARRGADQGAAKPARKAARGSGRVPGAGLSRHTGRVAPVQAMASPSFVEPGFSKDRIPSRVWNPTPTCKHPNHSAHPMSYLYTT